MRLTGTSRIGTTCAHFGNRQDTVLRIPRKPKGCPYNVSATVQDGRRLVRSLPDVPAAQIALGAGVGDTSTTLVIGLFKQGKLNSYQRIDQ